MPSFFGVTAGRNPGPSLFEIRLENEFIVLRGGVDDAASQLLKGTVILCLPQAQNVQDVHLRMTGDLKLGWRIQTDTPNNGNQTFGNCENSNIFIHRWTPFVANTGGSNSRNVNLPSGNYEWPFELVIPGNMAESVEGQTDSHITYKLKATVARGKFAHDWHAYKRVRIVRTLDPSALELAHAMTVENIWANKIMYEINIPQKAIVFGTAIVVIMRFTSLLKGLVIGKILCQLLESHEVTMPRTSTRSEKVISITKDIKNWEFELTDEHYEEAMDEEGRNGYTLKESMELPKTLSECMQDVNVHGIKIRHKVKFIVALHNPDGHTSELRATLPVTLFISPNKPLNENGELIDQTPMAANLSMGVGQHAPPLYGEHVLDQLYAGLSPPGIMSPAPGSAINTAINTPYVDLSRNGSRENLASLDGIASLTAAFAPAALSSRLQNLDLSANSRNRSFGRLHGSGSNTPSTQRHPENEPSQFELPHTDLNSDDPLGPQASDEQHRRAPGLRSGQQTPDPGTSGIRSGQQTPSPGTPGTRSGQQTTNLGDLSRVPSYDTAVRTPVRGISYTDVVPDYNYAISAPPSPERGFSSPATHRERRRHPPTQHTPIHPPLPVANDNGNH
ncbi:uncharacterized protein L3040_001641 [Drepanopeziza brunnea f. sp. 'multigermtubi']|uniref:uncharacterized protein n=1 Tax=Drepanopeziza brunnea f. sp. 'multigermtubi' TaxID=698441 RepID=UPI0023993408|nr:hypothetical protein L3040_001641 [Drepanopeziza brunnea f. sp. 'multigermtubi']